MNLEESPSPRKRIRGEATEDRINTALRLLASQTASLVGGGASLLFTSTSPDGVSPPQLRAAAGFATPEEAQRVANELAALARETLSSGEAQSAAAVEALEERGHAGTLALPLIMRTRVLGVLIVSHGAALSPAHREALETLAWSTAVQLDHPNLSTEFERLQFEWEEHLATADEKNDELLKLSEDLFAQDIELRRNNEKLGKIEKLKNDFIEKMSRELRTPLNSIIEATITVLAGENENLSEDSRQTLRRALDEGTAFQRTLENILDLWRIKQNELPVETQEFSFVDIIDEAIFSVQDTLGDKSVEILKDISVPLPRIRGDLAKINQILYLLLDNAAKFIERGKITIGARLLDDRLHCSIKDTGIGICADDQIHIWNEFYQVDERGSNKYRGAGLGLTLVHDLLILLGGTSVLESEPGNGTVVEFSIPVVLA